MAQERDSGGGENLVFVQDPPRLPHRYLGDTTLQSLLRRLLSAEVLRACEPALAELGALAATELYALQLADRLNEPRLVQWDAWGERIDRVSTTALWRQAERVALEYGLVADAYERSWGAQSRIVQLAKVYLFAATTDVYSCPLAMTDGAARALLDSGNALLVAHALPHLTSRDPAQFWTSGQWMTEATGGSDVGSSRTQARRIDGEWRLYGRKWFASAAGSQMALTLARPEGNPPGGRGLALFYLETRGADGKPNGIRINRFKDKLGTRKVPTAELELEGARAEPVSGLADGIRHIAPMLNVTRTWNAIVAVSFMRQAIDLATDYARRRIAFGSALIAKPLHRDALAAMEAECRAGLHLALFVAELMGRSDDGSASEAQLQALRALTPIAKALTARQATAVLSEAMEAFGGAGYVEDSGVALLVRDAHVLPIWEGTTDVLALDALRALSADAWPALRRELGFVLHAVRAPELLAIGARVEAMLDRIHARLEAGRSGAAALEADARRVALTLGRCVAAALMARHAQWALEQGTGRSELAAVRRFVAHGLGSCNEIAPEDAEQLLAAACGLAP